MTQEPTPYLKAPRLYVTQALSIEAEPIASTPEMQHYLLRVLRLGSGAHVRLFNGQDGEWLTELEMHASRRTLQLKIVRQLAPQPHELASIELAIPPLRKTRMEWLVEKACELGATSLIPVQTQRTAHHLSHTDRLFRRMIEAAEQSERMTVPNLMTECSLSDLIDKTSPSHHIIACTERFNETKSSLIDLKSHLFQGNAKQVSLCVLIGPEGGFDTPELEKLATNSHVHIVTLGPQILRSETAALLALGLVQSIRQSLRDQSNQSIV